MTRDAAAEMEKLSPTWPIFSHVWISWLVGVRVVGYRGLVSVPRVRLTVTESRSGKLIVCRKTVTSV